MGWDGMGWDGMGWDGMGWDGMGWDGMEGLIPGRGVITPHHVGTCSPGCVSGMSVTSCCAPPHPQQSCMEGSSFQDQVYPSGKPEYSGSWLLSATALNLLPLWGCLLFLSSCSSLIPQDFYSDSPGGFEINLDHRKLKTPQAKLFTVPSEALAIAVATEWDSQKDTIKFYTMHLTTLCNTALDNPTQRNKTQLIRAAVKFLETDTVWYEMGAQQDFGKRVR
uniref:ATP synthase mitochondrial F1 complex assembly factor 2 n=1 Tax=Ficedula albicollis TaxID=59894 RepID=A0A803W0T9_FICAL